MKNLLNKNQKMWGFALLLVLQELWTYQGFFLVAFKFYTFGSRFTYKRWVRVLSKIWILAFLGKYSNIDCWVSKRVNWGSHHILILFVGSQCVSIEVCIIWYQSTGSKVGFLSLYLLFPVIILSLFLLCSLFLVLILWHALG